jgi:hypothetical protein
MGQNTSTHMAGNCVYLACAPDADSFVEISCALERTATSRQLLIITLVRKERGIYRVFEAVLWFTCWCFSLSC